MLYLTKQLILNGKDELTSHTQLVARIQPIKPMSNQESKQPIHYTTLIKSSLMRPPPVGESSRVGWYWNYLHELYKLWNKNYKEEIIKIITAPVTGLQSKLGAWKYVCGWMGRGFTNTLPPHLLRGGGGGGTLLLKREPNPNESENVVLFNICIKKRVAERWIWLARASCHYFSSTLYLNRL